MNKKFLCMISLITILLILLGTFINWEKGTASAAAISLEVEESGLSYKHEGTIGAVPYTFSPDHLTQSDWVQSNINGFGEKTNAQIPALASFKGYLYAGTWKEGEIENSTEIWRTLDGSLWEKVDTRQVEGCAHLIEYDEYLYCGSWDGRIWRTANGTTWAEEISEGFGYDQEGIARFAVFDNLLYASTWCGGGTEIWRTDDGVNWTLFGETGIGGDTNNDGAISSEIYNDCLYWGVRNWSTGAQLWKTDGKDFDQVFDESLVPTYNYAVSSLASFNGYLYASLVNDDDIEIFRSNDDVHWDSVLLMSDVGSSASSNAGLEVNQNQLYLIATNHETGLEVWRTSDGELWEQVGFEGFGDSNNQTSYWDNGVTTFNNKLFVGITNFADGGEIWRYEKTDSKIFLPLIMNN